MNELLQNAEQALDVTTEMSPEEVNARFEAIVGTIRETPESLEAIHMPARKDDGRNDPQREFGAK